LNAQAPFFLAQGAFRFMKNNGGGKIINISSISAKYGGSDRTLHYGASKAALEAINRGLAKAGAPHNILVNAIRAGFIDTPMHKKLGRTNLEKRIHAIPLKKPGKAEDIARMALFLASEGGDFITGETFTVAGGD
jgi:NAD(P)-dependent dehydrogenase (short-subunit alcohol dehydrogenase family)